MRSSCHLINRLHHEILDTCGAAVFCRVGVRSYPCPQISQSHRYFSEWGTDPLRTVRANQRSFWRLANVVKAYVRILVFRSRQNPPQFSSVHRTF